MLRQPWKCQPSCCVSENNMKNQKSALAQHSIKEMMHTQLNPENCYFWYISRLSGKKKWCNHSFFYQVIQSLHLSAWGTNGENYLKIDRFHSNSFTVSVR